MPTVPVSSSANADARYFLRGGDSLLLREALICAHACATFNRDLISSVVPLGVVT